MSTLTTADADAERIAVLRAAYDLAPNVYGEHVAALIRDRLAVAWDRLEAEPGTWFWDCNAVVMRAAREIVAAAGVSR